MMTSRRIPFSLNTFAAVNTVRLLFFTAWLLQLNAAGQSNDEYFQKGLSYEKHFRIEEALGVYEHILKGNPNHAAALIHASRMHSNIGGRFPKDKRDQKFEHYERARAYALRAIELDPRSADARLAHIIALGLLSEISRSAREKVADAKLIHSEAKTILSIDPEFPEAYFVLGKWQLELSRLAWFELLAVRLIFGGLPEEVSKKAALDYFKQAIAINPNSILFLFGIASAYYDMGDMAKAKAHLEKAISLPLADPDDAQRKDRCYELLSKIQKTGH